MTMFGYYPAVYWIFIHFDFKIIYSYIYIFPISFCMMITVTFFRFTQRVLFNFNFSL